MKIYYAKQLCVGVIAMFQPVPHDYEIASLPVIAKLADGKLLLASAVIEVFSGHVRHTEEREIVISQEHHAQPMITGIDGNDVDADILYYMIGMKPLQREASTHYRTPPTLPEDWRKTVEEATGSTNNPYRLLRAQHVINGANLATNPDAFAKDNIISIKWHDQTISVVQSEMIVARESLTVVSSNDRLVAKMDTQKIVGLEQLSPELSKHYQHFIP